MNNTIFGSTLAGPHNPFDSNGYNAFDALRIANPRVPINGNYGITFGPSPLYVVGISNNGPVMSNQIPKTYYGPVMCTNCFDNGKSSWSQYDGKCKLGRVNGSNRCCVSGCNNRC